jgi:hypothetical protein
MQPAGSAQQWNLPVIETVGDLADWLSLSPPELEWFADLKGLCSKSHNPRLQHYCYRILQKHSGGVRLIESPKRDLKELQRRILSTILDRITPHQSVHGFVKGRSIVTFASPHVNQHIVLRLDLEISSRHFQPPVRRPHSGTVPIAKLSPAAISTRLLNSPASKKARTPTASLPYVLSMANDQLDLNHLLRRNKQLARRVNVLFFCSITATVLLAVLLYGFSRRGSLSPDSDGVLHVRGLAVVDASGKTRVRLQAPLPEPIIMGKQGKRDDSVSGVMIYDSLGNERGGYVTDSALGNAFLTLDSNVGQEVTLVAYPNGGAEFGINDDQKDKVVMGALENGPGFRLIQRGTTVFEQPPAAKPSRP